MEFKTNFEIIADICNRDQATLKGKEGAYAGSWQRRGGVGAFMMLARKWDRIENICRDMTGWDILQAGVQNRSEILDDIQDLRAYLLLVEQWVIQARDAKTLASARGISISNRELVTGERDDPATASNAPGYGPQPMGYVNQD